MTSASAAADNAPSHRGDGRPTQTSQGVDLYQPRSRALTVPAVSDEFKIQSTLHVPVATVGTVLHVEEEVVENE